MKFKEQKDLEENLRKFFAEALIERGNRLIVFIDELDRAKPSYAVHLLEQVKHYLCIDNVTFVFSTNLAELQNTIKHYYGESFDACRYLDRFFDLRISLPLSDKKGFYNELGLNSGNLPEKIVKKFIENYHLELREISRFYFQVKIAIYKPVNSGARYNFTFPDGKARWIILMVLVPITIGLKIVDSTLYDNFINGKDPKPLVDILNTKEFTEWIVKDLLDEDESLIEEQGKKIVSAEKKIVELYKAIFSYDYSGTDYFKMVGIYQFDSDSKKFVMTASSMLSEYVDLKTKF